MSSEPWVLLPVDQWHKLKCLFVQDWPRSVSGFTVLDTVEDMVSAGCDYGFEVYCPYGKVDNGMLAINIKSNFNEYIIQCPKDDTTKLEEALRKTNIIDWSKTFEIPFVTKHVKEPVLRIAEERQVNIKSITTTETFILNRKTLFEIEMPQGFTFEHLSLDYVQLADSMWPHRYPTSVWYFELLTNAKLGYGLFHNTNGDKQLVAWVFVKEMGALGHLYTLKEHRRKGYGKMVLKLIANTLMEKKKTVFAFCVAGNERARNMYIQLGFDNVQEVEWITFKKLSLMHK